eukprot:355061-Chlamydomonas_euryale.AAC.9
MRRVVRGYVIETIMRRGVLWVQAVPTAPPGYSVTGQHHRRATAPPGYSSTAGCCWIAAAAEAAAPTFQATMPVHI